MGTCRTCGAEIRWMRTPAGKAIPLDFEPDPDGNVVIRHRPAGAVAVVLGKGHPVQETRYMPHHATCPNWKDKS
jgi:hypothetical protein